MRWSLRILVGVGLAFSVACEAPSGLNPGGPFALEEAYSFPELLDGDHLTHFEFDGKGHLWVTTAAGRIIRVAGGSRTSFEAYNVLGSEFLQDLFVDDLDRAWVAGGESIAVFEEGSWVPRGPDDLFGLSPVVTQVAVNAAGEVLVAAGNTTNGGLLLLRGGRWSALTPGNSDLPGPLATEIEVAPDGSFWVASAQFDGRGGLAQIVDGRVGRVLTRDDPGLLYNWIDDLAVDGDHVFLGYAVPIYNPLGVPVGGIQEVSSGGAVLGAWFPYESGLTSNRVQSLVFASRGELWFTTGREEHELGCDECSSGIGMIDSGGGLSVLSANNYGLALNEHFPQIGEGPNGRIYVLSADRNQLLRVVR